METPLLNLQQAPRHHLHDVLTSQISDNDILSFTMSPSCHTSAVKLLVKRFSQLDANHGRSLERPVMKSEVRRPRRPSDDLIWAVKGGFEPPQRLSERPLHKGFVEMAYENARPCSPASDTTVTTSCSSETATTDTEEPDEQPFLVPSHLDRISEASTEDESTREEAISQTLNDLNDNPHPRPSSPLPWLWQCHLCHSTYRLTTTRRCLHDGHYFCSPPKQPKVNGESDKENYAGTLEKQTSPIGCRSSFDYSGWLTYNSWRRALRTPSMIQEQEHEQSGHPEVSAGNKSRGNQRKGHSKAQRRSQLFQKMDVLPEEFTEEEKKWVDCWNECDHPSECFYHRHDAWVSQRDIDRQRIKREMKENRERHMQKEMEAWKEQVRQKELEHKMDEALEQERQNLLLARQGLIKELKKRFGEDKRSLEMEESAEPLVPTMPKSIADNRIISKAQMPGSAPPSFPLPESPRVWSERPSHDSGIEMDEVVESGGTKIPPVPAKSVRRLAARRQSEASSRRSSDGEPSRKRVSFADDTVPGDPDIQDETRKKRQGIIISTEDDDINDAIASQIDNCLKDPTSAQSSTPIRLVRPALVRSQDAAMINFSDAQGRARAQLVQIPAIITPNSECLPIFTVQNLHRRSLELVDGLKKANVNEDIIERVNRAYRQRFESESECSDLEGLEQMEREMEKASKLRSRRDVPPMTNDDNQADSPYSLSDILSEDEEGSITSKGSADLQHTKHKLSLFPSSQPSNRPGPLRDLPKFTDAYTPLLSPPLQKSYVWYPTLDDFPSPPSSTQSSIPSSPVSPLHIRDPFPATHSSNYASSRKRSIVEYSASEYGSISYGGDISSSSSSTAPSLSTSTSDNEASPEERRPSVTTATPKSTTSKSTKSRFRGSLENSIMRELMLRGQVSGDRTTWWLGEGGDDYGSLGPFGNPFTGSRRRESILALSMPGSIAEEEPPSPAASAKGKELTESASSSRRPSLGRKISRQGERTVGGMVRLAMRMRINSASTVRESEDDDERR